MVSGVWLILLGLALYRPVSNGLFPAFLGELALTLWLCVRGAPAPAAQAVPTQ